MKLQKNFESLLQKYQGGLEIKMRESEFVFHSADLLHNNLHKIILNRGRSYIDIDSPKWLKNKRAIRNPKNNDGKFFHCALTAAIKLLKHKKKFSKNIKN